MSNARYLEIDSTYRNRKEWPKAGEFVVPISQTGRKNAHTAVDPVSESAAEVVWVSNAFNVLTDAAGLLAVAPTSLRVATILPGFGGASGSFALIVTSAAGTMQFAEGYYTGAVLADAAAPTSKARIVTSTYLGVGLDAGGLGALDRMIVTLITPLPLAVGTGVDIRDPSDLTSFTDPLLFVPTGKIAPNAYPGTIVLNQTQNEWRPVRGYSASTHLLQPDTTGSSISTVSSGPTNNWLISDTYSIRPLPTGWCGDLDLSNWGPPATPFVNTKTSFNFPLTATQPGCDLVGSFLEVSYMRDANGPIPPGGPFTSAFAAIISTSQMQIGAGSSTVDDFYTGCQIRLTRPGVGPPAGERRIITSYIGATQTITVEPAFSALPPPLIQYQIICGGQQESRGSNACSQEARRIAKYADYRDTAVVVGTNMIDFPATASEVNGYYTGMYIRVNNPPAGPATNLRLITSYVVTRDGVGQVVSRRATLDRAFSPLLPLGTNTPFTITSGVVEQSLHVFLERAACLYTPLQLR